MSAVFDSNLPSTQRLVMLSLADHADDDGRCYPSISRLCKRTGLSERAVQSNLKRLQSDGYLTIKKNAGPKGSNVFFVHPTPAANAPPQQMHPAANAPLPPQEMHPTPAADAPEPSGTINKPPENTLVQNGNLDVEAHVVFFNEVAGGVGWPKVRAVSPSRRSALRARIKDAGGVEGWQSAIRRAAQSPFLTGDNNRGWVADFDFLCQSKSFLGLMEGKYDPRTPKSADNFHDQFSKHIGGESHGLRSTDAIDCNKAERLPPPV